MKYQFVGQQPDPHPPLPYRLKVSLAAFVFFKVERKSEPGLQKLFFAHQLWIVYMNVILEVCTRFHGRNPHILSVMRIHVKVR